MKTPAILVSLREADAKITDLEQRLRAAEDRARLAEDAASAMRAAPRGVDASLARDYLEKIDDFLAAEGRVAADAAWEAAAESRAALDEALDA